MNKENVKYVSIVWKETCFPPSTVRHRERNQIRRVTDSIATQVKYLVQRVEKGNTSNRINKCALSEFEKFHYKYRANREKSSFFFIQTPMQFLKAANGQKNKMMKSTSQHTHTHSYISIFAEIFRRWNAFCPCAVGIASFVGLKFRLASYATHHPMGILFISCTLKKNEK